MTTLWARGPTGLLGMWLLAACTPLTVESPAPPAPEPTLELTRLTTTQCADPVLVDGRAPALSDRTVTATVVLDGLPSAFALDVAPDGSFAVPKESLAVPVELLCEGPCTLDLTVSLEAPDGDGLLTLTATTPLELTDDRTLRYADLDGDTFAGPNQDLSCPTTPGFSETIDDCDDTRIEANPAHPRIHCDGVDNDCDGVLEHVVTLQTFAEGVTPAEQLQWALDNIDDGGQILLCDQEPFVGSFTVDARVAAMGPYAGEALFLPEDGPALTLQGVHMLLTRVAVEGDGEPCLHIADSVVELVTGRFERCRGAIDVDRTSSLTWRQGRCANNEQGCLSIRGSVLLDQVDVIDNHAERGGGIAVDGILQWDRGLCGGNTATDGGCLAVGPGGSAVLGRLPEEPLLLGVDNEATGRGNQVFVQGTLDLLEVVVFPTGGPADDDIAVVGGMVR